MGNWEKKKEAEAGKKKKRPNRGKKTKPGLTKIKIGGGGLGRRGERKKNLLLFYWPRQKHTSGLLLKNLGCAFGELVCTHLKIYCADLNLKACVATAAASLSPPRRCGFLAKIGMSSLASPLVQ